LYVTYDTPQTPNLYHSVVDIGCRAANGQGTGQDVFNEIWAKFESTGNSSIDIYSVTIENGVVNDAKATVYDAQGDVTEQGNELYYYKNDSIQNFSSTEKLLQHKDGTCVAWASLLSDVLRCQGINAVSIEVSLYRSSELPPILWEGGSITLVALVAAADAGIHNNVNPAEKQWSTHQIVKYAGTYYDPSYGTIYDTDLDIVHAFTFLYRNLNSETFFPIPGTEGDETWITVS